MRTAFSPVHGASGRHRYAYWLVAATFVLLLAFSTLPSPLYGLYAARDGFSSLTITLIYAAYALGVVASLVLAGHLSDVHGRRPVLCCALALDVCSAVVFIVWPGLVGLYVARIVCGLSVGITSSTATAYLAELYVAHRPAALVRRAQFMSTAATLGGLGVGAGAAGVIADQFSHPLVLPYVVWLVLLVLVGAGLLAAPEMRPPRRPRPPYRPQRLTVPPDARAPFLAALLGVAVVLAVLGMFVGLSATVLSRVWQDSTPASAGLTVLLVFAVGVVVAAVTNKWSVRPLLTLGVGLLICGLVLTATATWLPSPSLSLFLFGGAVLGAGGAAAFKGTLGVVSDVSHPDNRAAALATFFLAGYVGLSLPVVLLGIALQFFDVRVVLSGFAALVIVVLLASMPPLRRHAARPTESHPADTEQYKPAP